MTNLNIISVLTLLGIFQGLVLLVTLISVKDGNRKANLKLIYFLITLLITLSAHVLYLQNVFYDYPHITLLLDHLFFLYGPLLFLYIEDLLKLPPVFGKKRWIHFIPSVIYLLIILPYAFMPPNVYLKRILTGHLWQYPLDQGLALIHLLIYLCWGFLKVKKYEKDSQNQIGYAQWTKYIYAVLFFTFLCWLGWSFAYASSLFGLYPEFTSAAYSGIWGVLSIISCTFGFYAIKQPEIFKLAIETEKYKGSLLKDEKINEIEQKLKQLMESEKPYLKSKITLDEIAVMINENKKDVSRVINEKYKVNFFDFISSYRIDEFKRLATPENLNSQTILSLALDAGFNSKSSFNSVFKKITGSTPSQYLKSQTKN